MFASKEKEEEEQEEEEQEEEEEKKEEEKKEEEKEEEEEEDEDEEDKEEETIKEGQTSKLFIYKFTDKSLHFKQLIQTIIINKLITCVASNWLAVFSKSAIFLLSNLN